MFIRTNDLSLTKKISYDEKIFNSLSEDFIKKYQIIPYCLYQNQIVLIYQKNLNLFITHDLDFLLDEYYLEEVEHDFFEKIYNLVILNRNHDSAINEYQFEMQDEPQELRLNEEEVNFYNVEISKYPVVKIVDSLIEEAIYLNASDVHLEPTKDDIKVRFRIDGVLKERQSLPKESLPEIITRIKVLAGLDITKHYLPQDGKYSYNFKDDTYDIRVSVLPIIYGEMITLRILKGKINDDNHLELKDLNINTEDLSLIQEFINYSSGFILVVGPTGSGKSTTLASFLRENVKRKEKIITVEDPVEQTIDGVNQVQVNYDAGLSFGIVLRNILRQDPNIIMIGEIRDEESARIACRASLTGHLVYSTMHTPSAVAVANRLIDMNIEPYLLTDSLKGIISQRLVRILCPDCKKESIISEQDKKTFNLEIEKAYYPCGCPKCNMTGYLGRRGIFQVIKFDKDFQELVMEKASLGKYEKLLQKKQIKSLLDKALDLVKNGSTSLEEVKRILS